MARAGVKMRLYWATTEDHSEDWFIVAGSAAEAAKFHEHLEGYDDGDAEAEWVLDIPDGIAVLNTAHAFSPELSRPATAETFFVMDWPKVYLPMLLR